MLTSAEKTWETVRFYVVTGLFIGFVGYITRGAISSALSHTISPGPAGSITVATNAGNIENILINNLIILLIVSVLPVINFVIFAVQGTLFSLTVSSISRLAPEQQFLLFYRHAVFEVFGLIIAVAISYRWLFLVRSYLNSSAPPRRQLSPQLRWTGFM